MREINKKLWPVLAWIGGAALLGLVLKAQDWSVIAPALLGVGWGVLWITASHLIPLFADTLGWRPLIPRDQRPSLAHLLFMRWVSESVNSLLPVAQVGGDLLRGRLLHRTGVPGAVAAAGIIVNLSLAAVSLVFFICIGGALLLLKGTSTEMIGVMELGLGLGAFGAALFIFIQRSGALVWVAGFLARQTSSSVWQQLSGQATGLNLALTKLYRDPRALSASFGWQVVAWLLGAIETWLAARWLGHPISVADSILVESLTQAVRNAAFVVPGALGVQEGGLLLIAPLAGLTPATGLAISLLKRARDLLLGVPGLVLAYLAFSRRGAR